MSEPLIYVDHSEVLEGRLAELKIAMRELVELVEAKEPQLVACNVYCDQDGTRMTVVHVHPDSVSLGFHMKVAGPSFPKFAEFIKLLTIDIYGAPSDDLLSQLRQKEHVLGNGIVRLHELHAGFDRL